ncbi:MAG: hypothetical protein MR581_05365 [Lachnospiraceae bacterium]|uniref:Uncharacterized protein n=1 Tax=Bilifractor porci TaxID=2606636 RepID=A0A7X2P9U4_9FIRM|nr:hypothetical protein [Bilifractor porci]MCI6795388.1 hypothetical protein [Lachnospiraceae bacterium]MDD7049219.1 hypothetical protein [Lachnospiraceae bacterium]MST82849.1 hypothetical protein [Bilifractor porci]
MSELTQTQADALIAMKKIFNGRNRKIAKSGESGIFELSDEKGKNTFYFDIDRRGKIEFKCKFQERYETNDVLVRLDINSPDHMNPDGTKVGRNHIHIYREGYADRWAYDIDKYGFEIYNSFQEYFYRFCEFCNIIVPDNIQMVL